MMITLNLEKEFLKDIDQKVISERYANRTELIREALRDKLIMLRQRELLTAIAKARGSKHTSKALYDSIRNDPHSFDSEELFRRVRRTDVSKK